MKFLFVTTISNTVNAFLIPHIKMLIQEGHRVDLAFKKAQDVNESLINLGCEVHELPFERSPLDKGNLKAINKFKEILLENNYDIVHTHTPIASGWFLKKLILKLFTQHMVFIFIKEPL